MLRELRQSPLLQLLAAVPLVFTAERRAPDSHTLLSGLAVLAIVPPAALLSRATESVAARTGDAVGGLKRHEQEYNRATARLQGGMLFLAAIALGSYSQIAMFVAPVLMLASPFIARAPMDLRFWPGAVIVVRVFTLAARRRHGPQSRRCAAYIPTNTATTTAM